jgi:hypothetical protein
MSIHNNRKPEPLLYQTTAGRRCPVCGEKSYSSTGIHPQCAVQQADAPRQRLLADAKRRNREQAELDEAATRPTPQKARQLHIAASRS